MMYADREDYEKCGGGIPAEMWKDLQEARERKKKNGGGADSLAWFLKDGGDLAVEYPLWPNYRRFSRCTFDE